GESLPTSFCAPLSHLDNLIRRTAGEALGRAVRPADFDGLDLCGRAQAEMGTRVVAAQVAGTGIDPGVPPSPAGLDDDLGAVGIALQGRVDGADDEPVAAGRDDVAEKPGRAADGGDEQIEPAVVVDVADDETAADVGIAAERGLA